MKSLLIVLIFVLRVEALKTATNTAVLPWPDKNISHIICLMNSGYSFFTVHFVYTSGVGWKSDSFSLDDIQKVGCSSDIIVGADLTMTQTDYVVSMFRDIPVGLYGMIWFNLAFGYQTMPTPSCDYIMSLGYNVVTKGKQFGIITDSDHWIMIFGAANACPEAAKFMLWNWNSSGTMMFGGWSKASRRTDPIIYQKCGTYYQVSTAVSQMEE
jgi:hypothetical protein